MSHEQHISNLMDGEATEQHVIDAIANDEKLAQTWARYHLVRDVTRLSSENKMMSIDVSATVFSAIESIEIEDINIAAESLDRQSADVTHETKPRLSLFLEKVKSEFGKFTQVGIAAGVALAIIMGVQHVNQPPNSNNNASALVTTPMAGIQTEAVGGIRNASTTAPLSQEQYNKIKLLKTEYELQRRLNTF